MSAVAREAMLIGTSRALEIANAEYKRRLAEINDICDDREDITAAGGPNIFMQIGQIARGEDRP
jgi:hypothetical protein